MCKSSSLALIRPNFFNEKGVVDRGFESQSGQTKDYKIGICCFSAKHVALRRMSKDWLARNQNNVSECSNRIEHKQVKIEKSQTPSGKISIVL